MVNKNSRSGRRHLLRLALSVIAATSLVQPVTFGQEPGLALSLQTQDVPQYPFSNISSRRDAKSSRALVSKFLGLNSTSRTTSQSVCTSPGASLPVIDYPVTIEAPATLPSNIANLPAALPPAESLAKVSSTDLGNSVVMAAAVSETVVEFGLSDDSDSDTNSLDASDLVNSLSMDVADVGSSFTDSIQIEVADEQTSNDSVNLSFSDAESLEVAPLPASRPPELITPQKGMSVSAVVGFANQPTNPTQPLPAVASEESSSRLPKPLTAIMPTLPAIGDLPLPPTNVTNASSRREANEKPIQYRIEGGPENKPEKTPLVALVAKATRELPVASRAPLNSMPNPSRTEQQSTDVSVAVKDSVALQSQQVIRAVSVEHEDVCRVIQTSAKTYSVIGLKPGQTRLAVISDNQGHREVEIHQVSVQAGQADNSGAENLATDINRTVKQLYPRSRVQVTSQGSQLMVSGSVDSEESAKKILSLVRKSTLTPVVDQLQVN